MNKTVVRITIDFDYAIGDVVRYEGHEFTVIGCNAYVYDDKRIKCTTYYDITAGFDITTHVDPCELQLIKACNISRTMEKQAAP